MAAFEDLETTVAVTDSSAEQEEEEGWSVAVQATIGIILFAMMSMNIIGNILTIIAFAKDRALQTVQNMYIVNLAATDLIIGVSSVPFYTVYTIMYFTWPFGYPFCKVWSVIDFWACAESSLTIILISYDRLLMVTDGISYNQQQTKRRAFLKIAMTWFVGFFLYAPAIIWYDTWRGYSTVEEEDCDVEFATEVVYTLVSAVIEFMIPFVLLTVFSSMLYWNIRKRSMKVRDAFVTKAKNTAVVPTVDAGSNEPNNTAGGHVVVPKAKKDTVRSLNRDKKAAKALATLVVVYAFCWTPYTIATIVISACGDCINEDLYESFNWLLWANSSFNACIYAYTNEMFRARFKAMLRLPWIKRNNKTNVIVVKSTVTTTAGESEVNN